MGIDPYYFDDEREKHEYCKHCKDFHYPLVTCGLTEEQIKRRNERTREAFDKTKEWFEKNFKVEK